MSFLADSINVDAFANRNSLKRIKSFNRKVEFLFQKLAEIRKVCSSTGKEHFLRGVTTLLTSEESISALDLRSEAGQSTICGGSEYRSSFVAQEITEDRCQELFAGTPPLAAKDMLMSMAREEGMGLPQGRPQEGMYLDFVDVRRAYFYADSKRTVYAELPPEDHGDGMCGNLVKPMYGTRDAAHILGA